MQVKLGCHMSPPRDKDRVLKVGEFRTADWSCPPTRDWYAATSGIQVHRNAGKGALGICTIAGKKNLEQVWTANAGREYIASDAECVADYSAVSGYDPRLDAIQIDGEVLNPTDSGACATDVLRLWQASGQIGPYMSVEPRNWDEVCYAMNIGIGLYCALILPAGWMKQMQLPPESRLFTVPDSTTDRKTVGGHCVIECSYDHLAGKAGTGTWGQVVQTTADAIAMYYTEMYVIFSNEFMRDGLAPNGLDGPKILDALEQVKRG